MEIERTDCELVSVQCLVRLPFGIGAQRLIDKRKCDGQEQQYDSQDEANCFQPRVRRQEPVHG